MLSYFLRRLAMSVLIIFIVVSLSFFMIRLMPGNPMDALEAQLRGQGGMSELEIQARLGAAYGVTPDAPVLEQYLQYLANVARGDLGTPITNSSTTVTAVIAEALPWTLIIVALALLISFGIGIAVGAFMASRPSSLFARVMTFVVSLLSSIPNYIFALLLIFAFTATYRVFPTGGAYDVDVTPGMNGEYLLSVAYHATLPIIATVLTSFGGWALGMKGSAVSVLGAEYVRAAESRGLSNRRITQSYVGRNAMLPMVTQLALAMGFMFGGSVFIETYFQYPGLGYYLIRSVNDRDYSLMMGCFLLISVSVILTNLLVDLLYPLIDPRIARPATRKKAEQAATSDDALPVAGGTMA